MQLARKDTDVIDTLVIDRVIRKAVSKMYVLAEALAVTLNCGVILLSIISVHIQRNSV